QVYATHGPVIALLAVPPEKTHLYGVIAGKQIAKGLYHVDTLVEKPAPGTAPTNLSVLGRYVLPPEIFDILEHTPPGKGGEIQLTDALQPLAKRMSLYGLQTEGRPYDAGDRAGHTPGLGGNATGARPRSGDARSPRWRAGERRAGPRCGPSWPPGAPPGRVACAAPGWRAAVRRARPPRRRSRARAAWRSSRARR